MPDSLARIGAAEGAAERTYRAAVQSQLAADATGIPRLSAKAEAAVGTVLAAKDDAGRRAAWKTAEADAGVGAELVAFRAAVAQWFGDDQVRTMLRIQGRPGAIQSPGQARDQAAIDRVAQLTYGLYQGERAAERHAQAERQTLRRGPRLRM